eukprot:2598415-Alexandrium_andersonii.AAC.1
MPRAGGVGAHPPTPNPAPPRRVRRAGAQSVADSTCPPGGPARGRGPGPWAHTRGVRCSPSADREPEACWGTVPLPPSPARAGRRLCLLLLHEH